LDLTAYIGLVAGFLIPISFIPQIIRVLRLKSAREISILFTAIQLLGLIFWLTYGIILGLLPIIICNIIMACLVVTLLGAKMKYGR
jgi:MtN3 and saliva related transmembrane protein